MRLALNQPYLIPYSGYFRLFDVDLFVFHDDAQFVKQSYINRNRLTTHDGKIEWLTLPLKDVPTGTEIRDMEYAACAKSLWDKQLRRFKVFSDRCTPFTGAVAHILDCEKPIDAFVQSVIRPKSLLDLTCPVRHSSDYADKIDPALKGQDRVLAICEHFKASEYINAPGGKDLYDPQAFKKRGIELKILKPYEGNTLSILERLSFEKHDDVRKEIDKNVRFI